MSTMNQLEQDVFAPALALPDALLDSDNADGLAGAKWDAQTGFTHHREAARGRLHRLRAIESLRRSGGRIRGI